MGNTLPVSSVQSIVFLHRGVTKNKVMVSVKNSKSALVTLNKEM